MPVKILPVSHICNFDQSPQSVEPVANTTLAPKGTGECVVKTGGKEKDRVTTQFCASLEKRLDQFLDNCLFLIL